MRAEGSVILGEGCVLSEVILFIPLKVSNISAQNPGTANQAPVICAQSNNMASRVPENYAQTPVASNQGSSSAEEDRQKVMDAAEALLILHNSSQAPQVPGSLNEELGLEKSREA